jgi:hypothetical protein|tara:strand:+ start:1778 stop:2341 length:564 start_codon:yes stop_codon:yes gene_type:complete
MDDEFIFTQTEYAKLLGISRECLRTRRRTGKLEGEYKVIDEKYFYKRPRPDIEKTRGTKPPVASAAKKRRRGQHYRSLISEKTTNYPNWKMEQHNQIKMMTALKSSVSREDLDLIPAAINKVKEERLKKHRQSIEENRLKKSSNEKFKNYGCGIYNAKTQQPKWVEWDIFDGSRKRNKKIKKGPYEI